MSMDSSTGSPRHPVAWAAQAARYRPYLIAVIAVLLIVALPASRRDSKVATTSSPGQQQAPGPDAAADTATERPIDGAASLPCAGPAAPGVTTTTQTGTATKTVGAVGGATNSTVA